MTEKALLLCALMFFAQEASGQGLGAMSTKGWGGAVSIQRVDNTTRFELDLGGLYNPLFEAGLKLMREEADNSDLAVTGVGPYISVYPLRQSTDAPLTLGIHSFVRFLFFKGGAFDALDAAGFDVTGNDIYLYGSLLHAVALNERVELIPEIEAGIARLEISARSNGRSQSESEIDVFGTVGGRLSIDAASGSKLAFFPHIRFSDGQSVFRFSVILLLDK